MNDEFLNSLLGLTENDCRIKCEINNLVVKTVREDNRNCVVTFDFRFNRINIELDEGLVTKCYRG
jgi:hypothetical protein